MAFIYLSVPCIVSLALCIVLDIRHSYTNTRCLQKDHEIMGIMKTLF